MAVFGSNSLQWKQCGPISSCSEFQIQKCNIGTQMELDEVEKLIPQFLSALKSWFYISLGTFSDFSRITSYYIFNIHVTAVQPHLYHSRVTHPFMQDTGIRGGPVGVLGWCGPGYSGVGAALWGLTDEYWRGLCHRPACWGCGPRQADGDRSTSPEPLYGVVCPEERGQGSPTRARCDDWREGPKAYSEWPCYDWLACKMHQGMWTHA